jgi:hypothetical protein
LPSVFGPLRQARAGHRFRRACQHQQYAGGAGLAGSDPAATAYIVDYLIAVGLHDADTNWRAFLTGGVSSSTMRRRSAGRRRASDAIRARGVQERKEAARYVVRAFLSDVGAAYDLVLIDSAPGLSV